MSDLYVAPEKSGDSAYKADANASLELLPITTNYYTKRGMEWELYPVGEDTYKIQNRWTGCFLNMDSNGRIYQSQETNENSMIWKKTIKN